jgi:hypothetical protein
LRIPLTVGNFYSNRKMVFANFFLRIPSMRVAHALSAVVDSGSPFTSISTRDALAFGIPIKTLDKDQITRLAGFTFYGKNVRSTLLFKDEAKNVVKFEHEIRILVPTKLDSATINQVQDIPSLVGTDLMEDAKLTFVYNPSELLAYFEQNTSQPAPVSQTSPTPPQQAPFAETPSTAS